MKIFRKLSILLVVCIVMSSGFAGCGNKSDNTSSDTTSKAQDTSAEKTQAPEVKEPVKLLLTAWGGPDEQKVTDIAIAKFNEKFAGMAVEYQQIPHSDYDAKITTMIAGNIAPDVAMMESSTITFPLAEQGELLNLKSFLDKDTEVNLSTLIPNIMFWSDSKNLIGIGPGPEMACLYYNVDMFKEAGVEPPPSKFENAWEWDEFVEVAKKMTIDQNGKTAAESGFDPKKIKQYGVNIDKGWPILCAFLYSNNADYLTPDGTKFGLSQPEAIDALQKVADLANIHHVAPSPVQTKALPGISQALQTRQVAMSIGGQWENLAIGNAGVNYNIGVLPKMKRSVTSVFCGMFSILSSTKHPDESWALMKELISPEACIDLIKTGLWMPSLKEWYTNPELIAKWAENNPNHPSGYKDAVIDMTLHHGVGGPTFYVKNFNKIMDIANPALDKVWLGTEKAETAMKSIEAHAQAQVQGKRELGQ